MKKFAYVVANDGLGDSISIIGMVNYLATKYERVYVTCLNKYYKQMTHFYDDPKIILEPYNRKSMIDLYKYSKIINQFKTLYDIYMLGNYGAVAIDMEKYIKQMPDGSIRRIITDYPTSYYSDVDIPLEYMTKYFKINYSDEILKIYDELLTNYPEYIVVHQTGSNATIDIIKYNNLNIDETLTIDVNRNLYPKEHKFHSICEKFINLSVILYYGKLLENATGIYVIDSSIHILALIVNIEKAKTRICYSRNPLVAYGIPNKFFYYNIIVDLDP